MGERKHLICSIHGSTSWRPWAQIVFAPSQGTCRSFSTRWNQVFRRLQSLHQVSHEKKKDSRRISSSSCCVKSSILSTPVGQLTTIRTLKEHLVWLFWSRTISCIPYDEWQVVCQTCRSQFQILGAGHPFCLCQLLIVSCVLVRRIFQVIPPERNPTDRRMISRSLVHAPTE